MPMWKIYHPKNAFSEQDKSEIAVKITDLYATFLPRFYVNVLFHPLDDTQLYIGGEPATDFVRVTINHIARSIKDEATQQQFLQACSRILNPYVAERGYRWELHIGETPIELWTVNGFKPPMPNTPAEQRWREENRSSAY
ncbi:MULTISPECIES: tautomerase family protein [Glaesserella]|uniref:4-oxalocrotonate tautomerase n=1 Tax=Glaesserella australis TaxID=2094024 RepID=A0A328BVR7_9PAST|nr:MULTISPECIES: tautomerase family protein [Glaesserella]AUI66007.1 4-oxalocrotonate tautomerase [Glaesserella sp. 15-184]RAL18273.1 4-oxalocrotonate tautomerase [Glaesserella australis]